jgi:hypothetical protein
LEEIIRQKFTHWRYKLFQGIMRKFQPFVTKGKNMKLYEVWNFENKTKINVEWEEPIVKNERVQKLKMLVWRKEK